MKKIGQRRPVKARYSPEKAEGPNFSNTHAPDAPPWKITKDKSKQHYWSFKNWHKADKNNIPQLRLTFSIVNHVGRI